MIVRVVLGLVIAVAGAMSPVAAQSSEDAAQAAAETWLALVDGAKYAASWEQASAPFKKAVSADQWTAAVTKAREPFGPFQSRKVTSRQYSTSLPRAPDGQYVVVTFETAFEKKAAAVETVVMTRDDGAWRVAGAFVR